VAWRGVNSGLHCFRRPPPDAHDKATAQAAGCAALGCCRRRRARVAAASRRPRAESSPQPRDGSPAPPRAVPSPCDVAASGPCLASSPRESEQDENEQDSGAAAASGCCHRRRARVAAASRRPHAEPPPLPRAGSPAPPRAVPSPCAGWLREPSPKEEGAEQWRPARRRPVAARVERERLGSGDWVGARAGRLARGSLFICTINDRDSLGGTIRRPVYQETTAPPVRRKWACKWACKWEVYRPLTAGPVSMRPTCH
jgi:hypothetical protein